MMSWGLVQRLPLRTAAVILLLVSASGCSYEPEGRVNIVISELEPSHGWRVLLWPADDEGEEWSGLMDDPGRAKAARVWRFSLPPADREPPKFADDVVHISVLLPKDVSRRLRHRASRVLERLDAVHPRASLCLVATDSDLRGVNSITDLITVAGEDAQRILRRSQRGHPGQEDRDGAVIFIR